MCLQEIIKRSLVNENSYNTFRAWLLNLNDLKAHFEEIKNYLSRDEKLQSDKITIEKAYNLYCLRKGIKRAVIGSYLGINPADLRFNYNKNGKPYISNQQCKAYNFNISHSKNYVLIGIDKENEIGVDIEVVRPKINSKLIANSLFSNEEMAQYKSFDCDGKICSFYKAWVQKEAISKALSLGISIGFNEFSVNICPNKEKYQYEIFLEDYGCRMEINEQREKDYFFATAIIKNMPA